MLHGLWSPGSGLKLWVDGHDGAGTDDPRDPVSAVLHRNFRHRVNVAMPPCLAGLCRVSTQLSRCAAGRSRSPAAVQGRRPANRGRPALSRARGAVDRWVRAGRVVPALTRAEGSWWPRWQLSVGERQRAWIGELVVAMPPVSGQSARRGRRSKTSHELTDPIVRRVLGDSHPVVQTPLWQAVLSGDAFDAVSVRAAEGLADGGRRSPPESRTWFCG